MPWTALIDLIEPHYPQASFKGGRPPYPLAPMLRINLVLQWYDLSDPAMEDALIEVPTIRRFAGIDMISDRIPDETTILAFRHLLEKLDLGKQIFEVVKAHLKANGMAIKQGTIIDATFIAAPSSTKNEKKAPAADLLHGEETIVYADAGHQGIARRDEMQGRGISFRVAMRPGNRLVLPNTPEGRLDDLVETAKAHIRAKGEHPFRVIKQQFGFQKTRLRGML